MVIDYSPLRENRVTIKQFTSSLSIADLYSLTDEMIGAMLAEIRDARDEDASFVPHDPDAYDEFASSSADLKISWTLGHVIVHTTASAEESAALALSLARGVPPGDTERSRFEMPWQLVKTVHQMIGRLEESRRMRKAMLNAWPSPAHLEATYCPDFPGDTALNAIDRFVLGLSHDFDHLGQIRKIMAQMRQQRA